MHVQRVALPHGDGADIHRVAVIAQPVRAFAVFPDRRDIFSIGVEETEVDGDIARLLAAGVVRA